MARGRARRFFRGVLRWTLRGVGLVLALVITLVLVLLYSQTALRFAVRQGLAFYNGKIPGEIAVGEVEGRLGTSFVLRGVRITDRDGRALVDADALAVSWSPWALLRKDLMLHSVELTRADVVLFAHADGASGFGDLAIPGPEKPPREGPGVGPDLPLDITIESLVLTDVDVFRGSGLPIVEEASLTARAHGEGQAAEVEILTASADLPGSRLTGLGLAAHWTDPVVVVDANIATNLGRASLTRTWFDAMALSGAAELVAVADNAALAGRTEEWLAKVFTEAPRPAMLSLAARGSAGDLSAELMAAIPGVLGTKVTMAGKLEDGPRLFATLTTAADLQQMVGADIGVVRPVVSGALEGDVDWQGLRGELDVRCESCGVVSGVGLWAAALQEPGGGWATRMAAQAVGASLTGSAEVADGALREADVDLTIVDIGVPATVARNFVAKIPELSGSLAVAGHCGGEPLLCGASVDLRRFRGAGAELAALGVAVQGQLFGTDRAADGFVTLEELKIKGQRIAGAEAFVTLGSPGDRGTAAIGHQAANQVAKAASRVAEDNSTVREQVASSVANRASATAREGGAGLPPLEIGVEAEAWMRRRDRGDRARVAARIRPGPPLEIDVDGLSVHLRGLVALLMRPTHVRIEGERIAVRRLDISAAGGRITADGHVDRAGRSDMDVDVDAVSLDKIAAAVPQLRRQVGGTVGVHVHLEGPARDPTLYLRADARELWVKSTQVGNVDVGVDLKQREAQARVTVVGPFADRVEVAADTRVLADLQRGKFGLLEAPLHADVDVEVLRLTTLRPWLAGVDPKGTLDVHAAVRGTTARPVAAVRVSGSGLAAKGWQTEGAAVVADVAYDSGNVHGAVEVHHLEAGLRLEVGSFPLTLDLVEKTAKWRPDDPVVASLVVKDFDLWRQLTPISPGQNLAGKVGLTLEVAGTGAKPEIAATVTGERLRVRDADIGDLKLTAGYADERARVDARVHGGMPGTVTLHAAAPVRLAPATGDVAWLKDQGHELAVRVREFDLGSLRAAGVDAPMRGRVSVDVDASGTPADPKIAVGTSVKDFRWRTMPVGSVQANASYAGKKLDATVKGRVGDRGAIDAKARVPLALDLLAGGATWDRRGQHDVRVSVSGIDRSALLPLGAPIPPDALIGIGIEATARGNLDKFTADVEMHGQLGHKVFGGSPVHLSAHVAEKEQRVRFALGDHIMSKAFGVRAETKADIPGLIAGTAKAKDIPLTAAARSVGVDLRFLKAFTPPGLYDPIGTLAASVDVTGTVGKPDVRGRVKLRGGGITVLSLQQRIRDVDVDVRGEGRHIELEKLVAHSGPGKLTTTATVDIGKGGEVVVGAEAVLDKFPLVRPGLPQLQIDSRIKAGIKSDDRGTDVDVALRKTEVLVTGYAVRAPKAIPDNLHVRGIRGELVRPIDVKQAKKEEKAAKAAAGEVDDGDRSHLGVNVKLVDPIVFTGPATEMTWSGALAVATGGAAKPVVTGQLRANEGRFDLLGNRFKIDTGEVTLPEGELTIDPFLSVVASTTTPVATVKVTIRGRVSRPQLIFSSEPSMPQQQILTLLLTGSADANEADAQKVLAEAATLLVIAENPALANFVRSATGLDYIGVSFGETTNQPILTVGKNVSKRIYAETSYKHNAPVRQNRVEAKVELEVAPHWAIETYFGDAAVGGVDLFWRKVFGKPQAPKAKPAPATPRTAKPVEAPSGATGP